MRWLMLLLVFMLGGLQYRLWLAEGSLVAAWAMQAEIKQQKADNARLQARNQALIAEVADLKQGLLALEERARSELGMIRRGETFFLLPETR